VYHHVRNFFDEMIAKKYYFLVYDQSYLSIPEIPPYQRIVTDLPMLRIQNMVLMSFKLIQEIECKKKHRTLADIFLTLTALKFSISKYDADSRYFLAQLKEEEGEIFFNKVMLCKPYYWFPVFIIDLPSACAVYKVNPALTEKYFEIRLCRIEEVD